MGQYFKLLRLVSGLVRHRITGARFPLFLDLAVTARCNMRCSYCFSGFPWNGTPDMPVEAVKPIAEAAAQAGMAHVSISGGEPLLRDDLADIIRCLRAQNVLVTVVTNGTLIPHQLDALRRIDFLYVSMDGVGSVNDLTRGAGAYEAALAGVEAALRAGIRTRICCQITRHNRGDLENLLRLAHRLGVGVSFALVFGSRGRSAREADLALPDAEARRTLARLRELKREGYPVLTSSLTLKELQAWPRPFDEPIAWDPVRIGRRTLACHGGILACRVDPRGDVYPCGSLTVQGFQPLNAMRDGFPAAFGHLKTRACTACVSTTECREFDHLCRLRPELFAGYARRLLPRPFRPAPLATPPGNCKGGKP